MVKICSHLADNEKITITVLFLKVSYGALTLNYKISIILNKHDNKITNISKHFNIGIIKRKITLLGY